MTRGGGSNGGRRTTRAATPRVGPARRRTPSAAAPRSRGAGRTGRVLPPGQQAPKPEKTLGGEQVEGRQAVRELLIAGRRKVREIWVANDLDQSDTVDDIIEIAQHMRVRVERVNRKRLETAARSEAPQGILARAAPLREVDFEQLVTRRSGRVPFLVAVDGVTDPGNLGAILRCCDGAGVDGVVLPRHRAVHVTPTVAKAAAGAVEHVPIALAGGLPAALARMKDAGIWVVGLDDASDKTLFELGDLGAEAVCMVLGAEGTGLRRLVRERCDVTVSIPMLGRLSSLNVAAAGALAVYEVARQRLERSRAPT